MIVRPLQTLADYLPDGIVIDSKNKNQFLLQYAQKEFCPEILSYMDNIDTEKYTFEDVELCSWIFYRNTIKLFRLPTPGPIDLKIKYSSVYSQKIMREYFKGSRASVVNMRMVLEILLLYNFSRNDLATMSQLPCIFELDSSEDAPDIELLKSIYGKKEIARRFQFLYDQNPVISLPPRILKGMEYPSFADTIHLFRAFGIDPYEAFVAFATKDEEWLKTCSLVGQDITAFDVQPVHLLDKNVGTDFRSSEIPQCSLNKTYDEVKEEVLSHDGEGAPLTQGAKTGHHIMEDITISIKIKVRHTCQSDSWENDNPNKNEPGFYWESADGKTLELIYGRVSACVKSMGIDILHFQEIINSYINLPYKSQIICKSPKYRVSIDLF